MILELKDGPLKGRVIDTNSICNGDDIYCPVHGWKFRHTGNKTDLIYSEVSFKYDILTGKYIKKAGEQDAAI